MPTQAVLGMNPMLALLPPDQQQNLMQLQQQQAIGQALLQQGMQPLDTSNRQVGGVGYRISPLEGLSKIVQTAVGNKMARDSMGQQAQIMGQMYGNAFGTSPQQPQQQPQAQQQPQQTPVDAGGMTGGQSGPGVQSSPVAMPGPAQPSPAQPSPAQLGQAMSAGAQPAQGAAMPTRGPLTIPGMSPQQSMMLMSMAPDAYGRAMGAAATPTDATRMALAAGIDPAAANAAALTKANYIAPTSVRPGGYVRDPYTGQMTWAPQVPQGAAPQFNSNGQFTGVVPMPGAADVAQQQSAANAAGKAQYNVMPGFDANGRPVYTTAANIANGVSAGGGASGGPGAAAPGGVNPGRFSGYQAPGGAVTPSLAPGVAGAAEKVAGANADRYNQAVQFGVDSPTRQNVLDNVIQLSQSGVQTGPGSDWQNNVKGMIANTPGLNKVFPNWQGSVGDYQELKKYLNQNGLRAWQAAGGTGTDSQMDAAMHANPNDTMFPQALQTMASWAKAGELAGTARANFYQQFKQNNGGVSNLDQADQTWRNNFDPKIFQLQTYAPAQQQTLLNSLSPQQAQQLMQKRAWFKENGLLQ